MVRQKFKTMAQSPSLPEFYAIQNPYVTGQIIIVDGGGSLT
jgi:hypothetical protein